MSTITRMIAVKTFFESNTNNKPTTTEFMSFWKACSEEERTEFGNSAAQQLGVELEVK